MSAGSSANSSPGAFHPAFKAFLGVLLVAGVVARIVPLFDLEGRLFEQFPTEDGYLMLTIARNLAIGNGFSVAAGEIPTNGTQPLLTLVYAVGFVLSGGGRAGGVLFAEIVQIILSVLGAWLLYRLGMKVLQGRSDAPRVSALVSAVWFSSALTIVHTMNCLETGPYGVMVIVVGLLFAEGEAPEIWSISKCLWVGAILGAVFWTRNDGCFLILAACLTYLFAGREGGKAVVIERFKRTLVFGATSVAVASPWLIFNYVNFGHIMPVSGRAESLTASFGANMMVLPVILAEYINGFMPIPKAAETNAPAIVACAGFVLGWVWVVRQAWLAAGPREKNLMLLGSIYIICLSLFYGLYFGAGWFMPRYLFPAASLFMLLAAQLGFSMWRRFKEASWEPVLRFGALAGIVVVVLGFNVRVYQIGEQHMHFQVVEWLKDNVGDEVWVGAIQTGTIGFFHDRTINLDGKVNPAAYDALIAKRPGEYVVNDTQIQYLADWIGMLDWMKLPAIKANFDVVVGDKEKNLGVLKRKSPSSG